MDGHRDGGRVGDDAAEIDGGIWLAGGGVEVGDHVQSAADLHATWFNENDTVGITAGTSTPDDTIIGVEQWLNDFEDFQARLAEHMGVSLHSTGV